VAGMAVSPGDIVHMDICGAAKFPASKLPKVLEYATELIRRETEQQKFFREPIFSLAAWKEKAMSR